MASSGGQTTAAAYDTNAEDRHRDMTAPTTTTTTTTATRRLMALYAHPDDEGLCSGSLIRYAQQGAAVQLVCATRGELGEISDPALATKETLPQVREQELRTAAQIMGVEPPIFLDYFDSGMAGWETNNDPNAYIQQPDNVVVPRIAALLREFRPQAVVTFDPTGGYGHPDHLAIHRQTHAAVELAADASADVAGEPWQVSAIWYGVFPRSFFDAMRARYVELGLDTAELDAFEETGVGFPDAEVARVIDVSAQVEQKFTAIYSHATQFGGDDFFSRAGEDFIRKGMSLEHFALGYTAPGVTLPADELL